MRFFAFITLTSFIMLFLNWPFQSKSHGEHLQGPKMSQIKSELKTQFSNPQLAVLAWAMATGEKKGLSPKTSKKFNLLGLGFLFSPSGIHFSILISMVIFLIKKCPFKKFAKCCQIGFLILVYTLPYLAIKRIVLIRLIFFLKPWVKLKWNFSIEIILISVFIISYFLGHYQESPIGFIYSFLFIGTFIAFREHSKLSLILGLFSTQLLVACFGSGEISFLAILISLPTIFIFTLIAPLLFFYLFTYQFIHFNWLEPILKTFMGLIQFESRIVIGSFMNVTLFLFWAVWILILKKEKKYFFIAIMLHGNLVFAPTIS
jgi:predicted membrane metal-binding protein